MSASIGKSEKNTYPNVSELISGKTARQIASFHEDHYVSWKEKSGEHTVNLLQVEFDLFDDHPSIKRKFNRLFHDPNTDLFYPFNTLPHAIHGTAVASIITDCQDGVAPGVNFLFTGADKKHLFEGDINDPYPSILPVLKRINEQWSQCGLQRGDIISISAQFSQIDEHGNSYNFPIDAEYEILEELEKLSDNGLIIFVAAGNSKLDLNNESFVDRDGVRVSYHRQTRGSPAIKVGYTGSTSGSRHWSNYGSMVSFFAPCGSVSTACYNYSEESRATDLIETFSGGFGKSSAATPLIASIAAKVQRLHKSQNDGETLDASNLKQILIEAGSPPNLCEKDQENQKTIGVFPRGDAVLEQIG